MKAIYLFIIIGIVAMLSSCVTHQSVVAVPANQSVEIDYPEFEAYRVHLKNRSFIGVDVAVLNKESQKQVKGFGLATKSKAEIVVESENKLVLRNNGSTELWVNLGITEEEPATSYIGQDHVQFVLANTSDQPIPLLIPNVMNPNLSPNSESGVDLKKGQEILFRSEGKKYVLLTVDADIEDGAIIDVADVLLERKKVLGL